MLLQRELSRLGLIGLASRVVVDTVPLSPYIGDVERYNAINKALKMDYISGTRCPNKFRIKENIKCELNSNLNFFQKKFNSNLVRI